MSPHCASGRPRARWISRPALERFEALVAGAVERGGEVLAGGRRLPRHQDGWFFEPTVLAGLGPDLIEDEAFGPLVALYRVADVAEDIARANASRYGLGASIFTEDLDEGMLAARSLRAGMVWINNPMIDNDALPFGGIKASGIGRVPGRHGLDEFRHPKMVIVEPRAKRQSWWLPYAYDSN